MIWATGSPGRSFLSWWQIAQRRFVLSVGSPHFFDLLHHQVPSDQIRRFFGNDILCQPLKVSGCIGRKGEFNGLASHLDDFGLNRPKSTDFGLNLTRPFGMIRLAKRRCAPVGYAPPLKSRLRKEPGRTGQIVKCGGPGGTRTPDLPFTKRALSRLVTAPAELPALFDRHRRPAPAYRRGVLLCRRTHTAE